jgi:hypothetical protein
MLAIPNPIGIIVVVLIKDWCCTSYNYIIVTGYIIHGIGVICSWHITCIWWEIGHHIIITKYKMVYYNTWFELYSTLVTDRPLYCINNYNIILEPYQYFSQFHKLFCYSSQHI